jgi:hypothetical protein
MAKHYGQQSQYLNKRVELEYYLQTAIIFVLGFGLGFLLKSLTLDADTSLVSLLSISIVSFVITVFLGFIASKFFIKSKFDELKLRKGLKGEGKVYFTLNKLSDDYTIFQDVVLGEFGNIDFIVVGPTGVMAVEVKNMSGNVETTKDESNLILNGKELSFNPLNQTYAEAKELEKVIDQPVTPILVFSNNIEIHFGFNKVKGVYVIGIKWLLELVKKPSHQLSSDEVTRVESQIKELCQI